MWSPELRVHFSAHAHECFSSCARKILHFCVHVSLVTAVCNVLATSTNRAPCACATITVTFGRRDLNRGSVLGLNSPDLSRL